MNVVFGAQLVMSERNYFKNLSGVATISQLCKKLY